MISRSIVLPKNKGFFLFGPRQTGKTTLLRSIFSSQMSYYYDLLDSDLFLRFVSRPSLLREEIQHRNPKITHVIIDEIQRIPDLLNEVHLMMELPDPPHFILTGSSARKLKRSKANLLAGRALTFHLFPLTAIELGGKFSLHKVLRFGSLPSIYLEEREEDAAQRLRSYVETYLKEEIELEAQIRQIGQFVRFLALAAFENGNMMNFSNISRETGTSYQTIKSYYQILEDTLVGQFLFPYSKSERKRLAKHPKFYLFDTGITRALTKKLTVPLEEGTSEFGQAFEHFIVLEIIRQIQYQNLDFNLSYYRTDAGAEVDLIIETPKGNTFAVEIKGKDVVDSSHLRGLRSFQEISPSSKLCCVCLSPRRRKIGDITILPWQELMDWIKEQEK